MSKFVTYEKFATLPEFKEFTELLQANNIPYELEDDVQIFDASFAHISHHRDYRIQLLPEDFERVNELRNKQAEAQLNEIDPGYYLFQFTDDELIDLISKQDEWSPFDFQLAQKILKNRGREVSKKELEQMKDLRVNELAKPEKHDTGWIIIGYIFAFLGGLIGIIIGYYIVSNKKTLPTGEQVYTYSKTDRKHGSRILIIAGIMIILAIAFRVMNNV